MDPCRFRYLASASLETKVANNRYHVNQGETTTEATVLVAINQQPLGCIGHFSIATEVATVESHPASHGKRPVFAIKIDLRVITREHFSPL